MAFGQTVAATGFEDPSSIRIAPGQVVPLFVTGLKTIVPKRAQALTVPLPNTLVGLSVTLRQTSPALSRLLPIFSVEQFNHCAGGTTADCMVTAITVQIPFDITLLPNPALGKDITPVSTEILIAEDGVAGSSFVALPVPNRIHVLRSCDLGGTTRNTGVCFPIVAHADGTLVLQAARAPGRPPLVNTEAVPGEVLVMYAYGLGQVSQAVQAGTVNPTPAASLISAITLQYDYRPNAEPSMPAVLPSITSTAQPLFVGLTPGQIGLYQINFVVPPPPPGTPLCGAAVQSNLTISVAGDVASIAGDNPSSRSFDGAGICVDPGSNAVTVIR